jgi:predicted SpoU family rRNA methylase
MASLIHMHVENYGHRNEEDDHLSTEIVLPRCATIAVGGMVLHASVKVMIIACGPSTASVAAVFGLKDDTTVLDRVIVNRDVIELHGAAGGKALIALVPAGISDSSWVETLTRNWPAERLVILDCADKPAASLQLPQEITVFRVSTDNACYSSAELPAPLLLDGAPAAVITRALESDTVAVALRTFGAQNELYGTEAAERITASLLDVIQDIEGVVSTCQPVSSSEYLRVLQARVRRIRASTSAITASSMFS